MCGPYTAALFLSSISPQRYFPPNAPFLFSTVYITRQTITDSSEPQAVARPMGSRLSGKNFDVRYAPGTRTSTMDKMLWMNDSSLRP